MPIQQKQSFNGFFRTRVGWYQDKQFWNFGNRHDGVTLASAGQVINTSLQTDDHAITSSLEFSYGTDALPATQRTASKHCKAQYANNEVQ